MARLLSYLRAKAHRVGLGRPAPERPVPANGVEWMPALGRVEIEITTDCNLKCINCDRSTRQAPSKERMSVEQIKQFCAESISTAWPWERITLLGGEPTLHPELTQILDVMHAYHQSRPGCEIEVDTNGFGPLVKERIGRLPGWVGLRNTEKSTPVQAFNSYNVAPLDLEEYRGCDFRTGCWVTERMGLGLTRNGFYACGAGASVDRVFGFNLGLRSLADVTMTALKDQMATLCSLCGHFKRNRDLSRIKHEEFSPSWQKAYERYKLRPPQLTLYGSPAATDAGIPADVGQGAAGQAA